MGDSLTNNLCDISNHRNQSVHKSIITVPAILVFYLIAGAPQCWVVQFLMKFGILQGLVSKERLLYL